MLTFGFQPAGTRRQWNFDVASSLSLTGSLGITNLPLSSNTTPSQKFRGKFQEASKKSWPGRCYPGMGDLACMFPGR